MKIIEIKEELKKEVHEYLKENECRIISIDGKDGSGKTCLAEFISKGTSINHVQLDEKYLIEQRGTYVENIKYVELKRDIDVLLERNKTILVDGICVLKVLHNIKLKSDLKIYVKKMKFRDRWKGDTLFDYTRSENDIINEYAASKSALAEMSV